MGPGELALGHSPSPSNSSLTDLFSFSMHSFLSTVIYSSFPSLLSGFNVAVYLQSRPAVDRVLVSMDVMTTPTGRDNVQFIKTRRRWASQLSTDRFLATVNERIRHRCKTRTRKATTSLRSDTTGTYYKERHHTTTSHTTNLSTKRKNKIRSNHTRR